MSFPAKNNLSQWRVGTDFGATRAAIRQIDSVYLGRILDTTFKQSGSLFTVGKTMQDICTEAANVVAQVDANDVNNFGEYKFANDSSLWAGWDNDGRGGSKPVLEQMRGLARLRIYRGDTLENPLAIGDFLRFFADLFEAYKHTTGDAGKALSQWLETLQNPAAFNKTTNRIRVRRRDILEQWPDVGAAHWYLPPEDVLGAIDRLFGYYEVGDISGSTTDALGALAILMTCDSKKLGTADAAKPKVVTLANDGRAFCAFAGMVIQMHHSLPETMMAINLIPPASLPDNPKISRIYSPMLTNADLAEINADYTAWQLARNIALAPPAGPEAETAYTLISLQDVYQMPNAPSESHEFGVVAAFDISGGAIANNNNNSAIFGAGFYNAIVTGLMNPGPGPAITLERLSRSVLAGGPQQVILSNFNPPIAPDRIKTSVVKAISGGMNIKEAALGGVTNYVNATQLFIDPLYGAIDAVPA
ncbi:hypothetical protein [uncultured Ruegeria sp.]|uniref:hypothetical protein n=1 Tax=uncultured Ruegeria sp. TaxID=259304 RepID=UPI002608FA7D|nr:hypothetical protein [uncultured Ruegeria sp.]